MKDETPASEFRCFRCGVSHKIAEPTPKSEYFRCEVCAMRYWSTTVAGGRVRVGISPSSFAA